MKTIIRRLALLALLPCATALAAESATSSSLGKGAFSETYSFTTVANYSPTMAITTLSLSAASSQFSTLSFQVLNSEGQALTNPVSLSTFAATKSRQFWTASFRDNTNANINLAADTTYRIQITGIAKQSGVKYSLLGNQIKPGTFVPAVPEPGTYAMLIAGFGLIGAVTRRRRKA